MCGPNAAGAIPQPLLREDQEPTATPPGPHQRLRSSWSAGRPGARAPPAVGDVAQARRAAGGDPPPPDRRGAPHTPTSAPIPTPTNSYSTGTTLPWRPDLACLVTTALLALTLPQPLHAGLVLSDHIRHFEPVFYDHQHLLGQHHRSKRDVDHVVNFQFTAHNRLFKLRLVRDTKLFAKDVIFETSNGPIDFDLSKIYKGKLEDDDLAEVAGVVTKDGLFDGHVKTQNNLYYLEPAKRYLDASEFHSVMYKASDVDHPMLSQCASEQLHFAGRVHTHTGDPTHQAHKHDHSDHKHEAFHHPNIPKIKIPDHKYFKSSPLSSSSISSSASQEAKRHASTDGLGPKHKAVTQRSNRNSSNLYVASDISNGGPAHATTSSSRSTSTSKLKHSTPYKNTYTFDSKSWHFVNELNNQTSRGGSSPDNPYTPLPHSASLDAPLDFDLFYEPTSANWAERKETSKEKLSSENESINTASNTPHKRGARRTRAAPDPSKTTCMLYLQADHLFFNQIGSEEACIETMTRHVQRVNSIYKITDFDHDHDSDNIGFMIKRIKVHTSDALNDPSYRFPGNYGVEKFLELFSEEDYDSFCLAYMFTYRDFEGGTLGLAWTGDLKNAGGVCEKNGHYRGSLKSLNTGIVTLLNYGKHVPPAVSHVTLAHEIGHNFGSPHDPESDTRCTPGGEDGNYIMFARATSGDKKNNNKFSPCSLRQINSVLNSKARDSKGCFTEPQAAICGNGVVEEGEECDCGWEEDCEEHCCFPMKTNPGKRETPCTLRPGKKCSPTQGPCCDQSCRLKIRDKCRDDNGCRDSSFCNGKGPSCPSSTNKPNKTICNDEFVCYKGECTGSICLAYGLESCQCKRQSGDPVTKSCELCCKLPGEDQPCISSFEWNSPPYNIPDMYAKAGTPCDEYKGYCDVFNKCREVDPSGPLATLRRLLLSDESLANLQTWVTDHWYAVLFVVVAFIILLVAVIKVFGKTPEKLKLRKKKRKRTILHKNSFGPNYTMPSANNGTSSNGVITSNGLDTCHNNNSNGAVNTNGTIPTTNGTVDHTENHSNHVVHPTVVRANIPFKRKVNEVKRAATKAKRAARSQLGGRSGKKGSRSQKDPIASPSDSSKSVPTAVETPSDTRESRVKDRLSSRFSIISFKTFRPKSLSPDKQKGKSSDKNKSKSSTDQKNKRQSTKNQNRSRSPDKKRRGLEGSESPEKHKRSHSPNKRGTKEDERRKSRHRSVSPDKTRRSSSPDKYQRHRNRSPDKHRKMSEGNWLINKFLADEERQAKPIMNGSLICSMNDSLSSVNTVGGPNGSPLTVVRNGSTRALIATNTSRASPIRGIVNEAFISSPRGARTHSSLRVTKSVSPEGFDFDIGPSKYRRSISMEAYNRPPPASPDKRKRSVLDEGLGKDKKRRFSSPEKHFRVSSPAKGIRHDKSHNNILDVLERRRSSISPPSSKHSSKNNSYSSVPERLREKLSLITASPSGSISSIPASVEPQTASVEPTIDTVSIISSHSSHSASRSRTPKEWV